MKKILLTTALIVAIATSATAMTNGQLRNSARAMTDKMALELRLDNWQKAMVFDINMRYVNAMNNPRTSVRHNVEMRNGELRRVLTPRQFDRYMTSAHARWLQTRSVRHNAPAHHGYKVAVPRHPRR